MLGEHFGPRADPPEMAGVANSQSRHAMRRGARGGDLHRLPADDLAKAEIAIDDDQRAAIADDPRMPVRPHLARAQPIDVFRNADHAVRVVAHQARIDEMRGDDLGFAWF